MAVGLVTIWNQFRAARREQKQDIEASNLRSEGRLKEFFELRLQLVDNKIDSMKEQVKKIDGEYTSKLVEQRTFFSDWMRRVEHELERDRR